MSLDVTPVAKDRLLDMSTGNRSEGWDELAEQPPDGLPGLQQREERERSNSIYAPARSVAMMEPASKTETQRLHMNTGNRVHSLKDRGNDLYQTPGVAVRVLLKVETVPAVVWEPAAGPGSIVQQLRSSGRTVVATDLVEYGCHDSTSGVDFLFERAALAPCIVTNPPFRLAEEFVEHALELCPEVYMLLRVAFLEGLRWERALRPHLARVHVFAPRLPMMHREGWDGPVNSNSGMAFGWFSFQRGWADKGGSPTINWVNWKTMPGAQ